MKHNSFLPPILHFTTGRLLCLVGGLLLGFSSVQAQSAFFTPVSLERARLSAAIRATRVPTAKAYQINEIALSTHLHQAPPEIQTGSTPLRLSIPLPNGTSEVFLLRETQTLSPALAAENPTFKTYAGYGEAHAGYVVRLSMTSLGFDATIWGVDGDAVYFVKTSASRDNDIYQSYFSRDYKQVAPTRAFGPSLRCGAIDAATTTAQPTLPGFTRASKNARATEPNSLSMGGAIRTFRLAVATTGEWTLNAGGYPDVSDTLTIRTNALAKITAAVNRLNGIFERDLASRFVLVNPPVSSEKNLLFSDPTTDPYDNTDKPAQLDTNQRVLTKLVGTANFDIGHLFGTTGGGVASIRSLCDNAEKGQGYSARELETGDPFVVDYVAHELGHQFGMNHTYNQADASGACTTRNAETAYEVASGVSIMSYVGICSDRNLQQYVDATIPAFHLISLGEAALFMATSTSGCGTSAGTNTVPSVSVSAPSYSIPRLTPFQLTASARDTDSNDAGKLLYSWEQLDLAPSPSGVKGIPVDTYDMDDDSIKRPLFRTYPSIASPTRTYPSMPFILNPQLNAVPGENQPALTYTGTHPTGAPGATCATGTTCVMGERLPAVARELNFHAIVRDQRGGVVGTPVTLTVVNTPGAFRLTAFDTASAVAGNSAQTITWNVVDTDKAPINTANVRILFSADGGQTFPTTLLASTPNSGSAVVRMPNVSTDKGRIKLEAVGNVYFDINNANLSVTAGTSQTLGTLATSTSVCAGGTAIASVSATGGTGPYTYTWQTPTGLTFSGVTSSSVIGTVTSKTTGTQTLTLTVTDALTQTTTTQVRLTVSAPPALTITATPGMSIAQGGSLTLSAAGAMKYLWSTKDTTASITPQTSATGSIAYSVTGTAATGCVSVASLTVLVSSTAVGGSALGSQISFGNADTFGVTVLGNPTESETVDVQIRGTSHEAMTIRVLTAQGTLLHEQELQTTEQVQRQRVRLGNTPGLYFIQFITPTQTSVLKVSRL
jgi:hypothetical protein